MKWCASSASGQIGCVAVERDDRLAERSVPPGPLGDGELAGERLANHRVGEGEAPWSGLHQEPGVRRFVETVDDGVSGAGLWHAAQHSNPELESAQRRDRHGLVGLRRQARQPLTDDVEDALGQIDRHRAHRSRSSAHRPG